MVRECQADLRLRQFARPAEEQKKGAHAYIENGLPLHPYTAANLRK